MSDWNAGPQDHKTRITSTRESTMWQLVAWVVAGFLAWHIAVSMFSSVPVLDPVVTLEELTEGRVISDATVPVFVVGMTAALIFVAALVVWRMAVKRWKCHRERKNRKGMATTSDLHAMGEDLARQKAEQTRPTMSDKARKKASAEEIGFVVGQVDGEDFVLTLEDHALIVAPTGSGKSSSMMLQAALSAPGPLVVTGQDGDLLDLIAHRRSQVGKVWVFDPMDLVGWPEPMVWDPVAGAESGRRATARSSGFAGSIKNSDKESGNAAFFRQQAGMALSRLLHAAALSDKSMADVVRWGLSLDDGALEPRDIIATSSHPAKQSEWVAALASVATGAGQTVSSTRSTLAQALDPMTFTEVQQWFTPRKGVPTLDPELFCSSTDTLVLIANMNDASANLAPLCGMLLQEVLDEAKRTAARQGHRLDPPLRVVGDEITNVAPLPSLPGHASDIRKSGVQLLLAAQSISALEERFTEAGCRSLLQNMRAEIVLGGMKDIRTLERYSTLVGEVELQRAQASFDRSGTRSSMSVHTDVKPVMRQDQVRQIPDDHALVVYANRKPAMVTLTPWFQGPDARALKREQQITVNARVQQS